MKLGRMVKTVTNAVGIPQCGACKQREAALDKIGEKVAEKIQGLFQKRNQAVVVPGDKQ